MKLLGGLRSYLKDAVTNVKSSSALPATLSVIPKKNKQLLPTKNAPYSMQEIQRRQQHNIMQAFGIRHAAEIIRQQNTQTQLQKAVQTSRPAAAIKPVTVTVQSTLFSAKDPQKIQIASVVKGKTQQTMGRIIQDQQDALQKDIDPFLSITLHAGFTPETFQLQKRFKEHFERKRKADRQLFLSQDLKDKINQDYRKSKEDMNYSILNDLNKQTALDQLHIMPNEQKQVTTITSNDLDSIARAQKYGRLQVVYLRDDEDYICTSKTGWGAQEISTSYLQGIKKGDQVVLYDTITKRFYRYDKDTKESMQTKAQMNAIANTQQRIYNRLERESFKSLQDAQHYMHTLDVLGKRIESGQATKQDYDAWNRTYKAYTDLTNTEEFTALADKYQRTLTELQNLQTRYDNLKTEYQKYGLSDVTMNQDFAKALNGNIQKVTKARKDYQKMYSYTSDYDNPKQVNSIADAIRKFVGATCFVDEKFRPLGSLELRDIAQFGKDFMQAFHQTWGKPISYLMDNWEQDDKVVTAHYKKLLQNKQKEFPQYSKAQIEQYFGTQAKTNARLQAQLGTIKTAGGILLNNILVNLGETFDMANVLKAGFVGGSLAKDIDKIYEWDTARYYAKALEEAKKDKAVVDPKQVILAQKAGRTEQDVRVSRAMEEVMTKAYWGAYGTSQNVDYDMLWHKEEKGFGKFAATMALEIFLDPSTYISFGTTKLATMGSATDELAETLTKVIKESDFGEELTQEQVQKMAKQAIKHAVSENITVQDAAIQKLSSMLVDKAQTGGHMKHLIKDLPETDFLHSMFDKAKAVQSFMSKHDVVPESMTDEVFRAQRKNVRAIQNTLKNAQQILAEGTDFKAIHTLAQVKRSLDFMDSVAFNLVVPVKPVQKLAHVLADAGRKMPELANYFSSRLGEASKNLPTGAKELHKAVEEVEQKIKMVKTLDVLDTSLIDDVANKAQRAIVNETVTTEMKNLIRVLEVKAPNPEQVQEILKAYGAEDATFRSYLNILEKPYGKNQFPLVEMLEPATVGLIRRAEYLSTRLDSNVATGQIKSYLNKLHKGIDKLGHVAPFPEDIENYRDQLLQQLEHLRKMYIPGVSEIHQKKFNEMFTNVYQSITDFADATLDVVFQGIHGADPKEFLRTSASLRKTLQEYSDALYNAVSTSNRFFVDRKVDRAVFQNLPAYEHHAFKTDQFVESFKKVFENKIEGEVPLEELHKALFSSKSYKMEENMRVYTSRMLKRSKILEYFQNEEFNQAIFDLIEYNSPLYQMVQYHAGTPELHNALQKVYEEAHLYNNTYQLHQRVLDADLPNTLKEGLIDSLAGEVKYLNQTFLKANHLNTRELEQALNNMTEHLIRTSAEYVTYTRTDAVRQFSPELAGKAVNLTTPNTLHNVEQMLQNLEHIPEAAKYLEEDAEKYIDVFFSISSTGKYNTPLMLTLHHGEHTYTYKCSSMLMVPTERFAKETYGTTKAQLIQDFLDLQLETEGLDRAAFTQAVGDELYRIKQKAMDSNKQIRFIGFNNGVMGNQQNEMLMHFLKENAITLHNDITIDLADFLRKASGSPVYTASAVEEVRHLVKSAMLESHSNGVSKLLCDPEHPVFSALEYAQTLFKEESKGLPQEFIQELSVRLQHAGTSEETILNKLWSMQAPMKDIVFKEKVLVELAQKYGEHPEITSINVPKLLADVAALEGDQVYQGVYKLIDEAEFAAVFRPEVLKMEFSLSEMVDMREFATDILNKVSKISNPEILYTYTKKDYEKAINIMLQNMEIKNFAQSRFLNNAMQWVNTDSTPNLFALAMHLWESPILDKKALYKEDKWKMLALPELLSSAGATVFNNYSSSFTSTTRELNTRIYRQLTQEALKSDLLYAWRTYGDLSTHLNMKQHLAGVSASEYISTQLLDEVIKSYQGFMSELGVPASLMPDFNTARGLADITNISEHMRKIKKIIQTTGDYHRMTSLKTIMELSPEDFFVYLVRDAKNHMLIQTDSLAMRNSQVAQAVYAKLKELSKDPKYVVKVEAEGVIKIYHDLSKVDNIDALFQELKAYKIDYKKGYLKNFTLLKGKTKDALNSNYYTSFIQNMQKKMPDHWCISSFGIATQATVENIQKHFPESSRFNLHDMNAYGMFDNAFQCSVFADAPFIREQNYVQYYSDNIVKTIGVGLYQVRNNLEAITNKFQLYECYTQSLGYLLRNTQTNIKNYKHLNRILEQNGMVLSRGIEKASGQYQVSKISLQSNRDLRKAIQDRRILVLPNDVHSEMLQFIKGHNYQVKVSRMDHKAVSIQEAINLWKQKVRSARMTMWLLGSPATGIRNFADAGLKGVSHTKSVKFFQIYSKVPEMLNRYEELYAKVVQYYNKGDYSDFIRFYTEHADEAGMDLELATTIFAHRSSSSSGGMLASLMELQMQANLGKLKEACKDFPEITEEVLERVMQTYQVIHNKDSHKIHKDLIAKKEMVFAELQKLQLSKEATDLLTDMFYSYTPASANFTNLARTIPGVLSLFGKAPKPTLMDATKITKGKSLLANYLTFNANLFGAAEDYTRLAMFLYYTDELGYSFSKANKEVIKAQFDYAAKPQWLDNAEVLFPFSTFKLYNAAFWLLDAPQNYGSIRDIMKLTRATDVGYDPDEIVNLTRGMLIRQKIATGELELDDRGDIDSDSPDSIWAAMAQTIMGEDGVIATYAGQSSLYAELAGGVPLGQYHVLKIGNTFVESLSLMRSILFALPQIMHGEIPDLFQDNVYSPIWTGFSFIKHMTEHGWDAKAFQTYFKTHYYEVLDFVPFFGALANLAITHAKNGRLNLKDIWAIITNPHVRDECLHTFIEQFYAISGTVVPGLVGTVYEKDYLSKPVGTDWYNRSEEYKRSHRFVFGVSYVPTFFGKDPRSYVDYRAMFMRMGYTSEESMQILHSLFGTDSTNAPVIWMLHQELFDATLKHLLERGYNMSEALEILLDESLWKKNGLSKDLKKLKASEAIYNSVFYSLYDKLPSYIKYTDGQYSALKKYYKSQGYNEAQAYTLMLAGHGFIDVFGKFKTLTPEQRTIMEKHLNDSYYEFMTGLPNWYKYEDGATTRAIKVLTARGMSVEQARRYILRYNFYVDITGKEYHLPLEEVQERTKKNQQEFFRYYNTLPDAIKYEKGAYGRTLAYLVNIKKITQAEAKEMIRNGAYLTLDGILIDCRGIKRNRQYNRRWSNNYHKTYRKYTKSYGKRKYYAKPRRFRKKRIYAKKVRMPYKMRGNNMLTYSRQVLLSGTRFGQHNAFKVTLGYNTAASILSTKREYPASWRNVAQTYRSNMYRNHYAKYGMSRMKMYSGGWKSPSNPSTTKLRRQVIYKNRVLKNRRTF